VFRHRRRQNRKSTFVLGEHVRKTTYVKPEEYPEHKIHVDKMSVLSPSDVLRAAETHLGHHHRTTVRFRYWKRFLDDPSLYAKATGPAPADHVTSEMSAKAESVIADTELMLAFGKPLRRKGSMRFVLEETKKRLRLICWPRQLNDELEPFLLVSDVGDAVKSAQQVLPQSFARAFDMVKGYYQFELAPAVRPYYGFIVNGKKYVFTRAIMGANWAADLCQATLKVLGEVAVAGTTVKYFIHVDNIRFISECETDVNAVADKFKTLAEECQLTIEETDSQQFLGMYCDYTAGTVRVLKEKVAKLKAEAGMLSHGKAVAWHLCLVTSSVLRTSCLLLLHSFSLGSSILLLLTLFSERISRV
jgi:hypothetical protein